MKENIPLPQYHHPDHLKAYSTKVVNGVEGDAAYLFEMIEEVLYPDRTEHIRPASVTSDEEVYEARFNFCHIPGDAVNTSWAQERIDVTAVHTKFFGRTALKQVIDLRMSNVISKRRDTDDVILNEYSFQQITGQPYSYHASIRRSDLVNRENRQFEDMTAYDCGVLFDTLLELQDAVSAQFATKLG